MSTLTFANQKAFQAAIIAQADDEYYQESGWVAVLQGEVAAIGRYGHCSCCDTWDDLQGGDYSTNFGSDIAGVLTFDWVGRLPELYAMAERKADPAMPDRESDPKDYDHKHLLAVYSQILERRDLA